MTAVLAGELSSHPLLFGDSGTLPVVDLLHFQVLVQLLLRAEPAVARERAPEVAVSPLKLWEVTVALSPLFVPFQVVLGGESLAAVGADPRPEVCVDADLVKLHLGLAELGDPAYITDQLLFTSVLCRVAVVNARDVVIEVGQVGELLSGPPFLLTDFTLPVAEFQVDPPDVTFHSGGRVGGELTLGHNAQPLAGVLVILEIFSELLAEEVGGVVGYASPSLLALLAAAVFGCHFLRMVDGLVLVAAGLGEESQAAVGTSHRPKYCWVLFQHMLLQRRGFFELCKSSNTIDLVPFLIC